MGKICLALTLFSLSFLTVLAWEFEYFTWDVTITTIIQSTQIAPLGSLLVWLSWIGAGWAPWVLAAGTGMTVWLLNPLLKRWVLVFWAGLGSGAAAMGLMKILTMRPRPSPSLVHVLVEYPGFSYPSGHVVFFVQYFGFLYLLFRTFSDSSLIRCTALFLLGLPIVLIGYSRVYMGAHWPSDVAGGYLLGGVLLALMAWSYR